MAKTVGIPRGLFYYQYFPLWKPFFEELGAELVVSDFTTKRILDDGVKNCVDEACLPVKLYHGHIINLRDRVDYLFIPRFTSISRNEYICPKFGGLPDMIRHTFRDLPVIIDTEINLRKSAKNDLKAALEIGSYFSGEKARIKEAYRKALGSYREYRNQVKKGILPGDLLEKKRIPAVKQSGSKLNIAVLGHVYNLYDSFVNMDMLYKLRANDVNIVALDMIDEERIIDQTKSLNKQMFWNFGTKAIGGALHLLDRKDIDGIIFLMSFGCGVDSFVCDMVERRIRRVSNIPFIVITLDEHSGEAGLDTRLEAFIDMIRWRKRDEADISAYG